MKLSTFVIVTFLASGTIATGALTALVGMIEGYFPAMQFGHFVLSMQVSMALAATSLSVLLLAGGRRMLARRS